VAGGLEPSGKREHMMERNYSKWNRLLVAFLCFGLKQKEANPPTNYLPMSAKYKTLTVLT
jgi:hypothetical protein